MRRIIGIKEVCEVTGRSRSSVDRYLQTPTLQFPCPVRLGHRDRGWYEDEIKRWLDTRPRVDNCSHAGSIPPTT